MDAYRDMNVDKTEVEKHRITEREATKRARIKSWEARWNDTPGPVIIGLAVCITMCFLGYYGKQMYGMHKGIVRAVEQVECTPSVEVINSSNRARTCPGGNIVAEPTNNGEILVKCVCGTVATTPPTIPYNAGGNGGRLDITVGATRQ